ncbi:MAG TPA: putative Ig domain-containing protein [Nitrospira sp.]|nr:putative Ig domain-containing protein [Nitrospira sp.]
MDQSTRLEWVCRSCDGAAPATRCSAITKRSSAELPLRAKLALCLFLVYSGCTSDVTSPGTTESSKNRPPAIHSISIVPNPIVRQGVISAFAEAKDPDQDEVTFRFRWFVNGEQIPGDSSATLSPEGLKRGDRVTVEVVPHDGKMDGLSVRTAEVLVGNTPPTIEGLALEPKEPKVGDRIHVILEGKDIDGDAVQYRYKWQRNNQVVQEGEQNALDTSTFSRGDTITVAVIPQDQTGAGKEVQAQGVTIVNQPPKFTSAAPTSVAQGMLDYVVTASDPENDPVSFFLDSAPPGMAIDERTGRLQWAVPSASNASYHVRITVKDDHQGWAYQEFDVVLKSPVPS